MFVSISFHLQKSRISINLHQLLFTLFKSFFDLAKFKFIIWSLNFFLFQFIIYLLYTIFQFFYIFLVFHKRFFDVNHIRCIFWIRWVIFWSTIWLLSLIIAHKCKIHNHWPSTLPFCSSKTANRCNHRISMNCPRSKNVDTYIWTLFHV